MDVQITRRTAIAAAAAALPAASGVNPRERHHVFVYLEEAHLAELVAHIIARNLECDVTWMNGCRDTAFAVLKRHRHRFTMSAMRESDETETIFRLLDGQARPNVLRWPMAYGLIRDAVLGLTGTPRLIDLPASYKDRIRRL